MTNKLKGETIWVPGNYSLVSHWIPSCSYRSVTSVVHLIVTGCPTGKLCHPMNAFSIWSHYKYSTTPIWTVMPQPDIVFQYFLFNCTSFQRLFWIVEWTRGIEIDDSGKEGELDAGGGVGGVLLRYLIVFAYISLRNFFYFAIIFILFSTWHFLYLEIHGFVNQISSLLDAIQLLYITLTSL